CIGLLFAGLLAEVALRLSMQSRLGRSDRGREFFCRFDRQLGWAPLENITAVHKLKGLSGLVHQNQYGWRGPDDMQLNKLPGKKRILVFGDSYVWGFGADQTMIFSAPEVHGTNEEILNFGVSGYGTDQEYLFYQLRGTNSVEMLLKHNTAKARYARYRPKAVSDRDREGVDLTVAILKKFQEAAAAQKANFYVIFIPYVVHIKKHVPYNHPLVPLIAAG